MKILLIYNKKTAHKISEKKLDQVLDLLQKANIDYDIQFTKYSRHAIEIVAQADFANYDGIIAAGGDGTLFEIINGYFQNTSPRRPPIGIIPVGTGNAFARDIGFTKPDLKKAVAIIQNQKIRKIDVGQFTTKGKTCYYLNILGMGFVTDVTETALHFKIFGNFAYTIGVFHRLLSLKSDKLYIEIDGENYEYDQHMVEVSNSRYTANYLMAPNASLDDGLLDLTIAKKMSRLRLLKLFSLIFKGEHIFADEVETFQAKNIKIRYDSIRKTSPDGELEGETPIEITCLPQAVEMFIL